MTKIGKTVKTIIQRGKVKNMITLPPVDFEVVLSLVLAERLKDWPAKAKRTAKGKRGSK